MKWKNKGYKKDCQKSEKSINLPKLIQLVKSKINIKG